MSSRKRARNALIYDVFLPQQHEFLPFVEHLSR